MKKVTALILMLLFCVPLILPADAIDGSMTSGQIDADAIVVNVQMQQTLDAYFDLRNSVLSAETQFSATDISDVLARLSDNPAIQSAELGRMSATNNLATYHDIYLVNSSNSVTIRSVTEIETDTYNVDAYEWTWIDYNSSNRGDPATDRMGYATEHQMVLRKNVDNSYGIVSDEYSEFEMLTVPESLDVPQNPMATDIRATGNTVLSNSNANLNINYLIHYADEWVVHAAAPDSNLQNPNNYNVSKYGYYLNDCANFVSQCLREGGMVDDYGSGKSSTNSDGTQWWFDTYPDPQYNNPNVCPESWRRVSKFVDYWENQGYTSVTASTTTVFPGNPVYQIRYDEDSGEYIPYHIGICVGYNSSGKPIINAHNRDVYHVPYSSFGTSNVKTLQITTSNLMINKPADATEITPTATTQSLTRYMMSDASHYFTFTVTTPGTYTFESQYYTTTQLDTRAYLYKESTPSNGRNLYLYEVAQDDDSGDGLNFLIEKELEAGTYYLRVTSRYADASGMYYLEYSRS